MDKGPQLLIDQRVVQVVDGMCCRLHYRWYDAVMRLESFHKSYPTCLRRIDCGSWKTRIEVICEQGKITQIQDRDTRQTRLTLPE